MKKKITLFGLVMMIFTTIFGFANSAIAYYQMGYASIMWYVIAALLFFLPVSLMIAEYGSAFKEAKGGIYSWLVESVGERVAFIGTFIWLASWVTWLVSTASKVWIPFSSVFWGHDATQSWHFFGLTSTESVAILGIIWILVVTYFSSQGIDAISKVANVGGTFVLANMLLFVILSIILFFVDRGHLFQPIHSITSFVKSPNPQFGSPVALISFIIYAIFAYAGIETMGGVTDDLQDPEKTFPKGLIFATILITISYSFMILLWGISTNWISVLSQSHVNLGNVTYVMMHNLGVVFGQQIGLSHSASLLLGSIIIRFTAFSMFIGYIGSFLILVYSPIKSFILGSDKSLWPERMTKLNKAGMPAFAMWVQAIVVCLFIFFISFGGANASQFYTILTDMGNVSTSCPYLFLVGAFPFFKRLKHVDRPFEVFKNRFWTNVLVVLVLIILAGSIIFTCWQPIAQHDYSTAFWTIIGPIFFGGIAWIFYAIKEYRIKKQKNAAK